VHWKATLTQWKVFSCGQCAWLFERKKLFSWPTFWKILFLMSTKWICWPLRRNRWSCRLLYRGNNKIDCFANCNRDVRLDSINWDQDRITEIWFIMLGIDLL
jgi:hypothetical protein